MTKEKLQAIRERCEKATPCEWGWIDATDSHGGCTDDVEYCLKRGNRQFIKLVADGDWTEEGEIIELSLSSKTKNVDADFIAHARTDIPALLDYIAELEKR